jgi:predicted signal transduction protein with EAL and GGDEF domain
MRGPAWPDELIVTGSFGVATWDAEMPLHLAISNADQAMYQAKQAGRNQVRVHDARACHPPAVNRETVAFLQRKQGAPQV